MLWHVMVGDKQVGSLDEATISGLIADGRVTGASPVWRDGMADWKPLQDTPELAGLLLARTASPPPPPPKPAAQGPAALQGFAELDGPKVSASAKGF